MDTHKTPAKLLTVCTSKSILPCLPVYMQLDLGHIKSLKMISNGTVHNLKQINRNWSDTKYSERQQVMDLNGFLAIGNKNICLQYNEYKDVTILTHCTADPASTLSLQATACCLHVFKQICRVNTYLY